jgi:peroxiredoxin (alkyl hydroperoxide reductase subunit C)
LTAVAAKYDELKTLGAVVLAVSVDSPYTHKVWSEGELAKIVPGGLPYPMLSDPGGRIGQEYLVYDEENGVDIRGRFLIDPDGVLQAMEILAPAVGRNVQEMIRQVKACAYVRETGEATPAGWEPGKKALKPSPELAGKVCEIWSPEMAF